ncbi:DUF2190 family protein [Paenirhodobacter sp. CAU 1674]|uniref:DUF2190 family protein n=1 Tax=Paenirhodobacter sp. CAU 1674 TaxID=3032596 RepID=UPI0023D9DE0B|nr:DUF2190 family protein [Paenirhodobacter sp. CAU 1674]MDF2140853.1 DUF2190 family protein [Paenirhodobacter sp. CAU 1674]
MKNYVQGGDLIAVTAAAAVASGAGVKIGSLFGVAQNTAAIGDSLVLVTTGVIDLAKAGSEAWTVGADIYWDDTAKVATTTATDNTKVGVAVAAAGAADATGRLRLNGSI